MAVFALVRRLLAAGVLGGLGSAVASVAQAPGLTMGERIALARPGLVRAEAAAPADAATRAFLLYRAGGAWLDVDRPRAVTLEREAFAAARLIESVPLRQAAEHDILSDLLPLSPAAVLEALPGAEPETRGQMYSAAVNFALIQGDVAGAVRAFEQEAAAGVFVERSAAHVLLAIPEADGAARVRVFNAAFGAYKAQAVEHSGPWTASRLVARFWQGLPGEAVLGAIDILLARADERDRVQPVGSGGISYGENNLGYKSYADLELFAVAPALKKLAPAQAKALLAAHPAVVGYLKRFPGGLPTFDVAGFSSNDRVGVSPPEFLPMGTNSYATDKGAHSSGVSPVDMGLEFTIPLELARGLGVTGALVSYADPKSPEGALLGSDNTCPPDVPRLLAAADTVAMTRKVATTCGGPNGGRCDYQDESPRAAFLNNLAERCTYYRDYAAYAGRADEGKAAALAALKAQLQLVPRLPVGLRADYLARAADLYLRLGEREAAAGAVRMGFEVADALFAEDAGVEGLKGLPKAVWASAEVYRRMISLGVNADFEETRGMVEGIGNADLRELERVMMARALLGIPVRRQIVFYGGGSWMTGHSEVGYEDF